MDVSNLLFFNDYHHLNLTSLAFRQSSISPENKTKQICLKILGLISTPVHPQVHKIHFYELSVLMITNMHAKLSPLTCFPLLGLDLRLNVDQQSVKWETVGQDEVANVVSTDAK